MAQFAPIVVWNGARVGEVALEHHLLQPLKVVNSSKFARLIDGHVAPNDLLEQRGCATLFNADGGDGAALDDEKPEVLEPILVEGEVWLAVRVVTEPKAAQAMELVAKVLQRDFRQKGITQCNIGEILQRPDPVRQPGVEKAQALDIQALK